jgi:hypothetical protein
MAERRASLSFDSAAICSCFFASVEEKQSCWTGALEGIKDEFRGREGMRSLNEALL